MSKWTYCCCSVAKLCPTLYNPMDCFTVFPYLLEFAETHVHWVSDALQPSVAPLSFCPHSFPASGSFPTSPSSNQVAEVSVLQLQRQSFQWAPRLWYKSRRLGLLPAPPFSAHSLVSRGTFSQVVVWVSLNSLSWFLCGIKVLPLVSVFIF